jgi:hypothetical protein
MVNQNAVGGMFKMQGGIAYITHISKKGRAVGAARIDGEWYGPISWDEHGFSDLKKAAFNLLDLKYSAGNRIANHPEKPVVIKPISEFLAKKS